MSDTVNRSGNEIRFDRKIPVEHDLIHGVGTFGKDSRSMNHIKTVPYKCNGLFSAHLRTRREHRQKVFFDSWKKFDKDF